MQDYEAHVESEPLPGRPAPRFPTDVSAQDTGYGIGKGIEDVGNVASQIFDKVQTQARQTQVTDANNQLQTLMLGLTHDPKNGAFAKQGKDAFNLGQQYLPQFDQQSQAIVDSVADPRAKQAAQMMQQHVRGQLSEQLDTHELDQHNKYGIQTTQASIKIAQQQAAANYNHPDIIASNRDTMAVSIQNLAKQQGWSDEETQQATQQAYSSMHTDVIDRMLSDDKPQMAKSYLGTVKNEMDANAAWAADRTIDAHIKEKQNEQKQDISDRFNDSLQAAEYGLPNAITVNRAELGVLYPKDSQRRWDELQTMVRAGAQAKSYDHMTPDEIAADVKGSEPTSGGPEAVYQIKAQEIRARAAERSLSARASDPAQFVQNKGGWSRLDPSNPQGMLQELTQRANTQQEVSNQVGMSVPLLSKAEAHGIGQQLASSSPRDQMSMLTSLRATLPSDQAYEGIVHQIAPASPVTAVVGEMVNRPTSRNNPPWYNPQFGADPQIGERILRGEQILSGKGSEKAGTESDSTGTSKSGFALPSDAELQPSFQKAMGGAASNLFQGRAQTAELYYRSFKDYYAALAEQSGNTTGKLSDGMAKQAAAAVLGRPAEYGPSSVMVPHGMDPEKFEGNMDRAVDMALSDAGYTDKQKEAFKGFGVRELGNTLGTGKYVIQNQNGLPLRTPDGKETVIIDLRKDPGRGVIDRPGMVAAE